MSYLDWLASSLVGVSLLSSACGGGVGEVVRPKDYKGSDALGTPECKGSPKLARPLTVDLDSDTRGDLEAQMDKGVVVVSYDCTNLRVLSSCSIPDSAYEYAGVNRKEEVVQMKGMDELKVNLPLGSAKLGSEIEAGRTIDLGLVAVGRRTTASKVDTSKLAGDCAGATHYVQKAQLGAFSIATGSAGKAAAVAEIFSLGGSAASSSERKASSHDGSLEACRTSSSKSKEPPEECDSPLRVELMPILAKTEASAAGAKKKPDAKDKKAAGTAEIDVEENPCPAGFKLVDELCTQETAGGFVCDPTNEAECKEQCDKGDAPSCTSLGVLITKRAPVGTSEYDKALVDAKPVFKKACSGGHVEGCAGLGRVTFPWLGINKNTMAAYKEGLEISKKACDDGSAGACEDVAVIFHNGADDDSVAADYAGYGEYMTRACRLGSHSACGNVGEYLLNEGRPAEGVRYLSQACDGGDNFSCGELSDVLLAGKRKVTKDVDRGLRAGKRACALDSAWCDDVSAWFANAGKGPEAFSMAKATCDAKIDDDSIEGTCKKLGDFYATGVGTPKDPSKAPALYKEACEARKRSTPDSWKASDACRLAK